MSKVSQRNRISTSRLIDVLSQANAYELNVYAVAQFNPFGKFYFYVIFLVVLMYVNEFKTKGKIAPRIRKLNHITDINVAIS